MITIENVAQVFEIEPEEAAKKVASLTRREREVLDLMVHGEPNTAIAQALGISPKTLDIHRAHIRKKTGTKPSGLGRVYYAAKLAEFAPPVAATPG